MKSYNTPIPRGKLGQFDEILKSCGGRYIRNPQESPDQWGYWRVSFEYDDIHSANEHNRRWERMMRDIKETVRLPWWEKLYTKIINNLNGFKQNKNKIKIWDITQNTR